MVCADLYNRAGKLLVILIEEKRIVDRFGVAVGRQSRDLRRSNIDLFWKYRDLYNTTGLLRRNSTSGRCKRSLTSGRSKRGTSTSGSGCCCGGTCPSCIPAQSNAILLLSGLTGCVGCASINGTYSIPQVVAGPTNCNWAGTIVSGLSCTAGLITLAANLSWNSVIAGGQWQLLISGNGIIGFFNQLNNATFCAGSITSLTFTNQIIACGTFGGYVVTSFGGTAVLTF